MKLKIKQNVLTDNIVGPGMFHAIQGKIINDVEPTLAKRLIKDGLAVEYKGEPKPKPATPVMKKVTVRALANILQTDPHVYLMAGEVGQVGEEVAGKLVKLGQAEIVKPAKSEPAAV